MSISPESFAKAGDKQREQKITIEPHITQEQMGQIFATLYNLARDPKEDKLSDAEGLAAVKNAIDFGLKRVESFRGVTMGIAPMGSTYTHSALDLYTYLCANPHVKQEDLRTAFGDALQPMTLHRTDRTAAAAAR